MDINYSIYLYIFINHKRIKKMPKKNEEEIENQEVNAEDQPMNPENEDKNNEKDNEEKQMNEVSKEAHHPTIGESEEQSNERELDGKELMETSLKLVEDILEIQEVITFLNLSLLTDTPYYSTYINLLIHVDLLLYIGFG
ncbi:hypothetical protein IC582_010440 [Cucumis melo]